MKIITSLIFSLFFLFQMAAGVNAQAAGETAGKTDVQNLKTQTECPVLGGGIDKNLYFDYQGKRIYVCCAGCIDAVKADPEKYLKILAEKGQKAEEVPVQK